MTIGYGSGTNTHDIDFLECEDAVVEILTTYPQVRLAVHGHLNLSEKEMDSIIIREIIIEIMRI